MKPLVHRTSSLLVYALRHRHGTGPIGTWMSFATDDPTNSAWISHKSSAFISYFRVYFAYRSVPSIERSIPGYGCLMSSAFPVYQPQCRTFGVPKGLTPSTPVVLLVITWLREVSVCLGVSSTSRADQVTLSTPFYESGMLASILLVGRSPWSTRSPCRHDRLLDGRVECYPTNGMILVVPDEGVRRRGIRSQTAWLSTIIWAITPPRVVSSGLVLWCWAMELS
jgi:hypothetical protein